MPTDWKTLTKIGVFVGIGLIASVGILKLILWLLNTIFGNNGPDLW